MPNQRKGNGLHASERMMRLTLPCIVFFLIFFVGAKNVANAAGDHWCYNDNSCDARTWAGECLTGKQQSPIDFNTRKSKLIEQSTRLRFNRNYLDVQDHFFVKNNGHTIQLQLQSPDLSSDLVMDGDFLKGSYRFSQLHFHWGSHQDKGSEHTVDGNGYVAELHLVHYSNDYKSLTEAVASKNRRGLAVLGIFFEVSSEENHALTPIVNAISSVSKANGPLQRISASLNISALLPDDLSLWRYYGSLTTPSCNEVVHWTVFKKAVPISRSQWNAFLSLQDAEQHKLEDNYRPTQPIINRPVYFFNKVARSMKPDAGEPDSNPPADDTYFDSAQKAITGRAGSSSDDKHKPNNGANSGHAGLVNSAIAGFFLLSLFLQVMFSTVLKCI